MQRLRLRFGRGEELKFLSHLDLMRLWERAFRRPALPLAYSQGFTPHPRIALAAPLAVGMTSEFELMDVFLYRWLPPHSFRHQTSGQLPCGLDLLEVYPVGLNLPSLQSQVRFAEYGIKLEAEKARQEVESAVDSLLAATELPWHHSRDTGERHYDLRALIKDLRLADCFDNTCVLEMVLRCDSAGTGRPEQVAKALGFSQRPRSIHRTKLILG